MPEPWLICPPYRMEAEPDAPKPNPDFPHDIYGNPIPDGVTFGGTK